MPESDAKIIRIGSFNNSLYVGVNYGINSSKLFKESTGGSFTELSDFDENISDIILVNNNIYIALQNGKIFKSDSKGNFNFFIDLATRIRNLVFYNNNFYASNFASVIFKINLNGSFYEFDNFFNSHLMIILEVVDDYLYALTTETPVFFTAKENNKLSLAEIVLNKFWKAKLI